MNLRYFVPREEGDLAETQKIVAKEGHALLAKKAYAACSRKFGVKDGRPFFNALRELLLALGKLSYTKQPTGWHVTGGRFVEFKDMTPHQLFATWASVQQTIAKWVHNSLQADNDLWICLLEEDRVFKANDVEALMELLFTFLATGSGRFCFDAETSMFHHEGRLLKCLG